MACTRAVSSPLMVMLVALSGGVIFGQNAAAQEIKIGGTGNALGTIRLLGDAFSRKYPSMVVTVVGSLGSSGALKAVPKGGIDIGVSARAVNDDERSGGAISAEYARSPTVLAVSTKSSVTAVTREEIAAAYSGKLSHWPGGALVRPVLRQPGDDNTRQVKDLSPLIEQALSVAEHRPGLAFAVTDQEAADKIESIPGAIGVTTLALIISEGRSLRPLILDGVEPTPKNGAAGVYPLVKRFYFVTKPTRSTPVQQFIAFVDSPVGRKILAETGHWQP